MATYYIRRYKIDREGNKIFNGYLKNHVGLSISPNHWVFDIKEAKPFFTHKETISYIRRYDIKNCEVLFKYEDK